MAIDIKQRRFILDSSVIAAVFTTCYLAGYLHSINTVSFGVSLILPNALLVILAYVHLVLRKGRKYDESEHRIKYEILKTVIFTFTVYTSYTSGLSTNGSLVPTQIFVASLAITMLLFTFYLMAYRPNT